jgi:hypothetical protein
MEIVELTMVFGSRALFSFCFGRKTKIETNIKAITVKAIRPFAFLLCRQRFCLKKLFLLSISREA